MSNGVIRSGAIMVVVWTMFYITPADFEIPLSVIISGFVMSNVISVFENLAKLGVVIPAGIAKYLRVIKEEQLVQPPEKPDPDDDDPNKLNQTKAG